MRFFLVLNLLLPLVASSQIQNNFFERGAMYLNTSFGYQQSILQKNLDPIGNAYRHFNQSGINLNIPEISFDILNKSHVFLGLQQTFSNDVSLNVVSYLSTKYPNSTIASNSYNFSNAVYGYVGYGVHKRFKKFTLLPLLTIGIKRFDIQHISLLISNNTDNKIYTYYADILNPSYRKLNELVYFQYNFRTQFHLNSKKNKVSFYAEPALSYSYNKYLDVILVERDEVAGTSQTKELNYRPHNLNPYLQLGFRFKLAQFIR